jgi:hypothetical protein
MHRPRSVDPELLELIIGVSALLLFAAVLVIVQQ